MCKIHYWGDKDTENQEPSRHKIGDYIHIKHDISLLNCNIYGWKYSHLNENIFLLLMCLFLLYLG